MTENQKENGCSSRFRRNWITLLGTLKVDNIGRNSINREIVHTLIKTGMFGNLDEAVLGSYQTILNVVLGWRKPKKIPFHELKRSFALRRPGG